MRILCTPVVTYHRTQVLQVSTNQPFSGVAYNLFSLVAAQDFRWFA
jgi:hypothetical protein